MAFVAPLALWIAQAASTWESDRPLPVNVAPRPPEASVEPGSLPSQVAEGERVTPVATPSAAPPVSPRPDPLAKSSSPTSSSTPSPLDSAPSEVPQPPSPTPTKSPTPQLSRQPETASPTSRPAKARPSPSPSAEVAPKPRRKAAKPLEGWSPPQLTAGVNQLSFPRLNSGADVTVTVACQPASGCRVDAGLLTIELGSSVTVTWSAPRTRTHTAWTIQRTHR